MTGAAAAIARSGGALTAATLAGHALALVGDIDGDGFADPAIGSDPEDFEAGRVELVSGLTGALLRTHDATSDGGDFGTSVAGGSDLVGDAVADYVTTAALFNHGSKGPERR